MSSKKNQINHSGNTLAAVDTDHQSCRIKWRVSFQRRWSHSAKVWVFFLCLQFKCLDLHWLDVCWHVWLLACWPVLPASYWSTGSASLLTAQKIVNKAGKENESLNPVYYIFTKTRWVKNEKKIPWGTSKECRN